MQDGKLTRRSLLGSLSAIGLGSIAAGAGTSALLGDTESFDGNTLGAGEVDLKLDWIETYNGEVQESMPSGQTLADWSADARASRGLRSQLADEPGPVVTLDDVKPGDEGSLGISLHVFGNCAWLWLRGHAGAFDDNGANEPERSAGDHSGGDGEGELQEYVEVELWYDENCNGVYDDGDVLLARGTLADAMNGTLGGGVLLDGDRTDGEYQSTLPAGSGAFEGVTTVTGNPTCADRGLLGAIKIDPPVEGETTYSTPLGDVTVTVTFVDGEPMTLDWSADFPVAEVIVKGGDGANVYAYDGATTDTSGDVLVSPTNPKSGKPYAISHVTFCYDGETTTTPPEGTPQCFAPGKTQCLGFRWWLPDSEDVNVVQTDSATFDLTLVAEQARHNATPANPWSGDA